MDSHFQVGDFGRYWGVTSNMAVKLFLEFFKWLKNHLTTSSSSNPFPIDSLNENENDFCYLKEVAEPLQWITDYLTII
ncbi:hypothetical protein [Coxiella-like endosymbiont of Rhipicephalus sanguineus]|uniref:hypothetical protein n=1 Tax=Coxiella-like endosymbiont of Rhipicephalus sanguineus TaxID=1955402 RepID=UPI002040F015|nr:hypothetical protein [Coxiella-like endosymbiont of Rhipicephalus sanguineus]